MSESKNEEPCVIFETDAVHDRNPTDARFITITKQQKWRAHIKGTIRVFRDNMWIENRNIQHKAVIVVDFKFLNLDKFMKNLLIDYCAGMYDEEIEAGVQPYEYSEPKVDTFTITFEGLEK